LRTGASATTFRPGRPGGALPRRHRPGRPGFPARAPPTAGWSWATTTTTATSTSWSPPSTSRRSCCTTRGRRGPG
jgi:hypothetical protein